MKIYITMPQEPQSDTFLTPAALEKLNALGTIERNPLNRQLTADEVVQRAQDADVIVTCWGTCKYSKADIEKLPNLKMIAHTGGTVVPVVANDVYETDITAYMQDSFEKWRNIR